MKLSEFLRDYAATLIVLASVGIGTYANISVIDARVSAMEKKMDNIRMEMRETNSQFSSEQADQWQKLYGIEAEYRVNFEQHNHIDKLLDELKAGVKECEKRLG